MKHILPSLRMLLIMTVLTGVLYPLAVTLIGQTLFNGKANGSLIERGGKVIGSSLISQKFENERYFKPRPSAGDFNPLPSGGTNLAPTAKKLKDSADQARTKLGADAPQDLIFASASGLDPHISLAAARFQIARVASARGLNDAQKSKLQTLVESKVEKKQLGILGEEVVNVLELNLAVDSL